MHTINRRLALFEEVGEIDVSPISRPNVDEPRMNANGLELDEEIVRQDPQDDFGTIVANAQPSKVIFLSPLTGQLRWFF